jgi:hypothetical protein
MLFVEISPRGCRGFRATALSVSPTIKEAPKGLPQYFQNPNIQFADGKLLIWLQAEYSVCLLLGIPEMESWYSEGRGGHGDLNIQFGFQLLGLMICMK